MENKRPVTQLLDNPRALEMKIARFVGELAATPKQLKTWIELGPKEMAWRTFMLLGIDDKLEQRSIERLFERVYLQIMATIQ